MPSGGNNTRYYHADHLGTTRLLTDSYGNKLDADVYTAFGERVAGAASAPYDRYGYAGAWGYQTQPDPDGSGPVLDFPFLHVGHRYYDPSSGRFLQRDPIGIAGGRNVYAYARNDPTRLCLKTRFSGTAGSSPT
jgi:RHS repeat-associated protein